ncbi:4'-phosphopantetheinyl transferase family protein [Paenibacillus sp. GYB003]|uniref:4'-phosphopantetheinyl transferase family protein n=1 Tax=Paenibacillus sp. GYB003 TaxID=2994392 RepID=UPI002F962C95
MASIVAVPVPEYIRPEDMNMLLANVSPERRDRASAYYRVKDRYRSLLAEWLVRYVAVDRAGLARSHIRFVRNRYGKPSLAGNFGFSFNVSHSGDWVVLLWDAQPARLGVDVEQIVPIDLAVADGVFTAAEREELFAAAEHERLEHFYRQWTLKESCVKALGTGLSRAPQSFTVARSEAGGWHSPEAGPFRFVSFRLDEAHIVSACSDSGEIAEKADVWAWTELRESLAKPADPFR